MIFQLERAGDISWELRSNPEEYKKQILKVLHSKDSPYKNLDKKAFKDLEKSINEINVDDVKVSPYMDFVKYLDEPEEINRIKQATEDFDKTFSVEQFL